MDCLAAGFVLLPIGFMTGLKARINAGFAGVALSTVISLSGILTDIIMVQTEFETSPRSIERVRDFESETQSRHAPRRPGHLLRTSRIETTSSFEPHCYVQVGPDDDLLCSFINTFPVNAFLARADFFFQKRYRHSPTQHYL